MKNLKKAVEMAFIPPLYASTANAGINPNATAEEMA
jgi:hypothetical protein